MTSLSKKPIAKKRGRPLGSTKKPAAAIKTFKQSNEIQEEKLLQAHIDLLVERGQLKSKIANLEHQAIGYQAVVSYLEHQLEKTK
jgi:hypothetical protein